MSRPDVYLQKLEEWRHKRRLLGLKLEFRLTLAWAQ